MMAGVTNSVPMWHIHANPFLCVELPHRIGGEEECVFLPWSAKLGRVRSKDGPNNPTLHVPQRCLGDQWRAYNQVARVIDLGLIDSSSQAVGTATAGEMGSIYASTV